MGIFDSILGQVSEHVDVANMASKLGIDPAMAEKAIAALGQAHHEPGDTVQAAAAKTGLDTGTLGKIVEQIGGEGSLGQFAEMLKNNPQASGILGALDRDGDGNPLNDLAGMAKGLFGEELTMAAALKGFTALFGAVCAAIAIVHIALGPAAIPGSVPVNAMMDSEDRFYATLFLGFGIAMVWCARDLAARRGVYLALLATFFAGGLARIASAIAVGLPSSLFVFLGSLELVLPPLLWWWHRQTYPG